MRKEHSPSSPPSSDPLPSSVAQPSSDDNLKLQTLSHLDEEKTALWDLARSSPDHSLREFFAFVIRRRGTVFEELLLSPMTWFAFAVYGFVRLAKHGILAEEGERLVESTTPPEAFTRYLTTFTVFFTVFYTSQTYQRYNWGYDRLCDAAAGLFDCMFLARHELRRARALRFSRYLSVAYAASFAGASYEYSAEALLFPWIRRYHLLTESELQRLSDLEPDTNIGAYREVLVWASWVVEDAYRKDEINDHQRNNFNKNINRTRYALSSSWDYKSRPFPFIYVHLLYVSVFLFLGFNAHVYATTFEVSEDFTRSDVYTEVYGVVCIAILCFFVVGVYKISVAMSRLPPHRMPADDVALLSAFAAEVERTRAEDPAAAASLTLVLRDCTLAAHADAAVDPAGAFCVVLVPGTSAATAEASARAALRSLLSAYVVR